MKHVEIYSIKSYSHNTSGVGQLCITTPTNQPRQRVGHCMCGGISWGWCASRLGDANHSDTTDVRSMGWIRPTNTLSTLNTNRALLALPTSWSQFLSYKTEAEVELLGDPSCAFRSVASAKASQFSNWQQLMSMLGESDYHAGHDVSCNSNRHNKCTTQMERLMESGSPKGHLVPSW